MKKWVFSRKQYVCIGAVIASFFSVFAGFVLFHANHKPHHLILYGNVDVRLVDIGFRVPGLVNALFFEEGDKVPKGALMATLDRTPYDDEVNRAKAYVEAVKVKLDNAEVLLKRRLELISVGGVSQEDLDDVKTRRDTLKADLLQAEAQLRIAMDNLSYTNAYAPTDGVILTRVREPGTALQAHSPVLTLSVSSPVWVRAYVNEPHLGEIYYGMSAKVYTDYKKGVAYTGKIGFISPIAEFTPKTVETTELRTDLVYRLRVYVDNPDQGLVQGMPVTVKLKLKKEAQENR
ncbi:MAG: efflux RND transporter periplasmic adaptor subunit [Chlamydiota bacterium]